MNTLVIIYTIEPGLDYRKQYKWNRLEDFFMSVDTGIGAPSKNTIVDEAFLDDNLIDFNTTFAHVCETLDWRRNTLNNTL